MFGDIVSYNRDFFVRDSGDKEKVIAFIQKFKR
jgi:hypothetical protein